MDDAIKAGVLKKGMLVASAAFGSGLPGLLQFGASKMQSKNQNGIITLKVCQRRRS